MKGKKKYFCLFLLIFCLFTSGCEEKKEDFSAKESPGQYQVLEKIPLDKIEVQSFKTMSFTLGELDFSPDNKYLAVGSEGGRFFLYDLKKKKILWEKNLGVGSVTSVLFSADGKKVFLGEKSPQGNLYCLDTKNGQEIWHISAVDDLGKDLKNRLLPQIVRLKLDKQGHIYVSALRFEKLGKQSSYKSKIYCLNVANGEKKWTFPQAGTGDFWANWLSISPQEDRFAFATANYNPSHSYHYARHVYCLNPKNGQELWHANLPILAGEKVVTARYGPNYSPDGKNLVLFPVDGRAFCLTRDGKIVWERDICTPKEIDGVTFNSGGRYAYWLGEQILFATMNTYNSHNWQETTPVEHPNSNTIFSYDSQGKMLWKWKAGGSIEELAYNKQYLLAPVGRNVQLEDWSVHGLYLLDYQQKGKLVYQYHTKGPAVAAALSNDSRYLACLEAPIQLDDKVTIIGQHQLHILEKK